MTPDDAAVATAPGISAIGSYFMLDAATYGKGAELGFEGLDFYAGGRGGPLGDVDADVVAAAFYFFEPSMVRRHWEGAGKVMSRSEAAQVWAECGHAWGEEHFSDDLDAARLAQLAGRCVETVSAAGAPVFAGWRRLALPSSPKALALHHLNGLRELRLGLHGGATLAAGLVAVEAMAVKTPHMAPMFGWNDLPETAGLQEPWEAAEAGTNRAMARAFEVLTDAERQELAELIAAADATKS